MTKQEWKRYHRQIRIIRRECFEAATDVMLFGTGYVEHGPHVPDFVRHVPLSDWVAAQ